MLPEVSIDLSEGYEVEMQPSFTWKLDDRQRRIQGTVDGKESIRQTICCILNTERYEHIAYSWDYGVEFAELYGQPLGYALPEIKRRVTEALQQDDRIYAVDGFVFHMKGKGVVEAVFTVWTNYGRVNVSKEVELGV